MASISRRAAFGLPAALVTGGAVGAPSQPHPDAALLKLCQRHARLDQRFDALCELQMQAENAGDVARARRLADAQRRLVPYLLELRRRVGGVPAGTDDGLRAKAQVALTTVLMQADDTPLEVQDALLWSLCQDVLRPQRGP